MSREWWIGITKSGFSKWLVPKDPEDPREIHCFVGEEPCAEYVVAIELLPGSIQITRERLWDLLQKHTDLGFTDKTMVEGVLFGETQRSALGQKEGE